MSHVSGAMTHDIGMSYVAHCGVLLVSFLIIINYPTVIIETSIEPTLSFALNGHRAVDVYHELRDKHYILINYFQTGPQMCDGKL